MQVMLLVCLCCVYLIHLIHISKWNIHIILLILILTLFYDHVTYDIKLVIMVPLTFLLWPLQALCVMYYRTLNHLHYQVIWYETLWKVQARSLDPVAHPRAFQPLDQNIEVWRKDNYYVVSVFLWPITFLHNCVILIWNNDIPSPLKIHLYFQMVKPTRNIMHVVFNLRGPHLSEYYYAGHKIVCIQLMS